MHHYGDFLLNVNFKDPVVDNEQITLDSVPSSSFLDRFDLQVQISPKCRTKLTSQNMSTIQLNPAYIMKCQSHLN